MRAMHRLLVRTGEDVVEDRLAERDHQRLRDGEDDHRAEGEDGPRFVMREVAVEPAQHAHGCSALIIASARRLLAPGSPRFFRPPPSSLRARSRGASSAGTSVAMRAPSMSCCRSCGTTRFPALMFTRLE